METAIIGSLAHLFARDLEKLQAEIAQYPDDSALWKISGEIKNPAGNLCLHLCGNLQHFIGARLGNTEYVRNRDREFAAKNLSKPELLAEIKKTSDTVVKTLKNCDEKILQQTYPEKVFGLPDPMTTGFFLLHLLGHFNYHLGQINYHRRLISHGQ